jgi:transcriptional repressor NrdR
VRCLYCNSQDSKVIDSRSTDEGNAIRRRRECIGCGRRFTTYEKIEEVPMMVVKKDGRREPFDRGKILAGLRKACEKRPISSAELDRLVDEIEKELYNSLEQEIPSSRIGELIMAKLKDVDEVAYVRFASVYRQFKDINTFMEELKNILGENDKK